MCSTASKAFFIKEKSTGEKTAAGFYCETSNQTIVEYEYWGGGGGGYASSIYKINIDTKTKELVIKCKTEFSDNNKPVTKCSTTL